jgi:hypothetical protein
LTDEPFVKKDDVIILQDPSNPSLRDINRFHYIMHREARLDKAAMPSTVLTDSSRKILESVRGAGLRPPLPNTFLTRITLPFLLCTELRVSPSWHQ